MAKFEYKATSRFEIIVTGSGHYSTLKRYGIKTDRNRKRWSEKNA